MKNIEQCIYPFSNEVEAYLIASHCKMHALEIGISDYQASLFNAAVSEITINAVRYASGGYMFISSTSNHLGIEVTIEDHGQGIADLSQALTDGYSTFKDQSLGLGLGVAKRCSDEMVINKSDETGTSITLRKFLPVSEDDILVRAISYPAVNQIHNGNAYVVKQYHGDTCLIALIDSHDDNDSTQERGRLVANKLAEEITQHMAEPLEMIMDQCLSMFDHNEDITGQLKLSLMRICRDNLDFLVMNTPPLHWLSYDESTLVSAPLCETKHFTHGVASHLRIPRPNHFTCLLHSSGVNIEPLTNQDWHEWDVYNIATTIFNDCAYEDKDATVIVIRGNRYA
ncbi:ATP-binding protein [Vibrio sp. Isolate24]|uniref:ATP-binding protein n=1 Tax=Vibrio sp. Isolate24 TaxID=2908534 RepID=UPI001EFC99B2|nr:ATP-binding protein [Vibrio sp. Isolate24]MCG9680080.1 ATP-binding protein [Vibrio sp. Isolate24]